MQIREDALVEKRNVLNETRTKMSLQELRLFSVYMSRINARNEGTRCVRLSLDEFLSIIGYSNKGSIPYIKSVAEKMLTKEILVPQKNSQKNGEYEAVRLFKKCVVDRDDNGSWFVELDCHDDALSMFFNIKREYFTYKIRYALTLTSANHFRLYEILKQREKLGEFAFIVDDLRKLLGFENEYACWADFRKKVLIPAQKAISKTTDICFSFEPKKRGVGGTWLIIKFKVWSNPAIKNTTEEKKKIPDATIEQEDLYSEYSEDVVTYAELCEREFSQEELRVVVNTLLKWEPCASSEGELRRFKMFISAYHELERIAKEKHIQRKFGYFKKILEKMITTEYT